MNETSIFDAQRITNGLFGDLNERSRDVLISRFGIGKREYETLEAIGQRYSITRERVRQIESDALKAAKEKQRDPIVAQMYRALEDFVRNAGGVMDEQVLRRDFAREHFKAQEEPMIWRGLVNLLLVSGDKFHEAPARDIFSKRWYMDQNLLQEQEKFCTALVGHFKKADRVLKTEELVTFGKTVLPQASDAVILNYVAACTAIKSNVFDQWGLRDWPEIRPRGVKDKAHLVLKEHGKPLHFTEVAQKINEAEFSPRPALAQTVHNELIKDSRFVLVGRGLYALRDWGYEEGTVRDIIADELKSKGPLTKEEVVKAVLVRRFVKPSTVILNLNSFKKSPDGTYRLA